MSKAFVRRASAFVIMMLCMLFVAAPVKSYAANNYTTSKVTTAQKKKALAAYKNFLSKSKITVDGGYKVKASEVYFDIGYVNNDNMPDLIVLYAAGPRMYGNSVIYTYKSGKMRKIGSTGGDFQGYYKKSMVVQTSSRFDAYGNLSVYYERLNVKSNSGSLVKTTRYNKKGATYQVGVGSYRYKKISKSTFNSKLRKLVGKKKLTSVKMRANNAANRKAVFH